jgi:cyclopropane-fatty-acyl-phospholipid synthase
MSTDSRLRGVTQQILSTVDVAVDGRRPWDIRVHDGRFFRRVLAEGALGLGESYVDGWWDVERLDELFLRLASLDARAIAIPWSLRWLALKDRFINRQGRSRAHHVADRHYNLGNELFTAMLDPSMAYSCGYWRDARTLAEAQAAKLDLACRKLGLMRGQSVLDIGCGWGSFVRFAAEHYGVRALGINNSTEQTALGRELSRGLPVEIRTQDYREVTGTFDHVVSIGMFETRRTEELPDVFPGRRSESRARRPVPSPYDRQSRRGARRRRMDREIHLPRRFPADDR